MLPVSLFSGLFFLFSLCFTVRVLPHSQVNVNVLFPFSTQALIKQDNLDAFNEKDPYKADDPREDEDDNDDNDNSIEAEPFPLEGDEVMPPPIPHPPSERVSFPKGLPWAPKVRYCGDWLENVHCILNYDLSVGLTGQKSCTSVIKLS